MEKYGVTLFAVLLCLLSISTSFAQLDANIETIDELLLGHNSADTLITESNGPNIELIIDYEASGSTIIANVRESDSDDYSGDGENVEDNEGSTDDTDAYQCTSAGTITNPMNCNEYINCSQLPNGTFEQTILTCPPKMAYNNFYKRCTRDRSDCHDDGITCTHSATYEVANDNTKFWWCTPALIGGFHKFLVQCPPNEYYWVEYGQCFYDLNNLPSFGYVNTLPEDMDVIKMELKQFKLEEKQRLNEEKLKVKIAKKLQKQLDKQAKKEAKAKAKLIDSDELLDD